MVTPVSDTHLASSRPGRAGPVQHRATGAAKVPIFVRVAELIWADLGQPPIPGTALPGERELAIRHQVSRGTIIAALDHLAKRRLVDRLPARGTFVAQTLSAAARTRRIILPYPEPGISPEYLHPELLGISTELFRGMLDEALRRGHALVCQHFTEPENDQQLASQFRQIEDCDGAIFIGHQLGALRRCMLAAKKPCAMVSTPAGADPGAATITHDITAACDRLVQQLATRGYRSLAALMPPATGPVDGASDLNKIECLRAAGVRHGLSFPAERVLSMSIGAVQPVAAAIAERIVADQRPGEVLFCSRTDYIDAVQHLVAEGRIDPRRVPFFGMASGTTFRNLAPRPTYIRIDYYQMGRAALAATLDDTQVQQAPVAIPAQLVIGEST